MVYTHNIALILNLGKAKSSYVYEISTHVERIINSNIILIQNCFIGI